MFLGLGLGISTRGGGVSQPKLDLNFATGSYGVNGAYSASLPAAWAYTRSLAAYGQTTGGALTSFAVDTPRIISGRGLLLEPSRTNSLIQTSVYNNVAWQDSGTSVTVTANTQVAPDGTTTGDTLAATTAASNNVREARTLVASTQYVFSVYLKQGTATRSRLQVFNFTASANVVAATVTWSAGVPTLSATTGVWSTPEAMTGGWYRLVGVATTQVNANPAVGFIIFPDDIGTTGTTFAWNADVQAGSAAATPIVNTTTAQTRGEDEPRLTIPAGASRYIIDLEGGSQLTGSVTPGDTWDFSPSAIPGVSLKYVSRVRII